MLLYLHDLKFQICTVIMAALSIIPRNTPTQTSLKNRNMSPSIYLLSFVKSNCLRYFLTNLFLSVFITISQVQQIICNRWSKQRWEFDTSLVSFWCQKPHSFDVLHNNSASLWLDPVVIFRNHLSRLNPSLVLHWNIFVINKRTLLKLS